MAGPIQSAINATIGAATAGVAIKQGIERKEEKAIKEQEETAKKAEREATQAAILQTKAEREAVQLEASKLSLEGKKIKSAQMKQKAKEGYINAIREKKLGTRLGTRTSMAEYLMAASGGTLDRQTASSLAGTMTSREIRKIKEAGGARSGNKQ